MDKFIFGLVGFIFLMAFLACCAIFIRTAGIILFIVVAAMLYWLFKEDKNNEE